MVGGSLPLFFLHECDNCGSLEERTFTDSWTGKELCLSCLWPIAGNILLSPSEEDNLEQLLAEGRRRPPDDD